MKLSSRKELLREAEQVVKQIKEASQFDARKWSADWRTFAEQMGGDLYDEYENIKDEFIRKMNSRIPKTMEQKFCKPLIGQKIDSNTMGQVPSKHNGKEIKNAELRIQRVPHEDSLQVVMDITLADGSKFTKQ